MSWLRTSLRSAFLAIAGLPVLAIASDQCTSDAMLVFDGSGSMSEMGFNQLDQPRILEARAAVRDAIPGAARARRIGLIVYGPGEGDPCASVDLRFGPIAGAGPRIVAEVDALQPAGSTPLTDAVALAARVLDHRHQPGVVVLVTDGKETCGGTPCRLAERLVAEAADLTVHVIGYKVRGDHFRWGSHGRSDYSDSESSARCLADMTGGLYLAAESAKELERALRQTLACQVLGRVDTALKGPPGARPYR